MRTCGRMRQPCERDARRDTRSGLRIMRTFVITVWPPLAFTKSWTRPAGALSSEFPPVRGSARETETRPPKRTDKLRYSRMVVDRHGEAGCCAPWRGIGVEFIAKPWESPAMGKGRTVTWGEILSRTLISLAPKKPLTSLGAYAFHGASATTFCAQLAKGLSSRAAPLPHGNYCPALSLQAA